MVGQRGGSNGKPYEYLGHFRNLRVLEVGHNSGGAIGPLAVRMKMPKSSEGVKAPKVMPPLQKAPKDNPGKSAVSKKISTLVHEGTPQKQAVATALSMKRAGRLTKEGGYIRAK